MKRLMAVFIACLFVGELCAAEPAASAAAAGAPAQEQKKLISIDFQETPLSTVLDVMSMKTGRKFITDSELSRKRIVLTLRDVTPEEALNALLDTYNLYYIRQGETNIYVIKSKSEGAVTTVSRVFFLNYSSAKELEEVLKTKLSQGGNISADSRTNSIVVTDIADNIEKIKALIDTLDIPTQQVLLEAKIVDVKMENNLKLGTQITNAYRDGSFWHSPLELERANFITDYELPATAIMPETFYKQSFGSSIGGGQFGVSILQDDYNVEGMIEALKTDTNAKVLTNPKLLVVNNQEATIDIVDQLPYETRSVDNSGNSVYSTEFKDVGIKLKVKPQINRDGSIILAVVPEQSFKTGVSATNVPIINTSRASTTFMLRNGETAVIGGLIRETDSLTENKVPLLGDIPIIGYLFKRFEKGKNRSELTIFITARIIQ